MRGLAAVLAAVALSGATARAQDCEDSPVPCEVDSQQGLKCAASKPNITEIVVAGEITISDAPVTCNEDFEKVANYTIESSTVEIFGHVDGSQRSLRIRSEEGELNEIVAAAEGEGLFKCWPTSPVAVSLSNLVLDGGHAQGTLINQELACSVSLDSVQVRDFAPGAGELLMLSGDRHMEVHRSRFDDISGTVIRAWGGLVSISQSVFSNCGGQQGAGALVLEEASEATLTGNLFWGCHSTGAGGAIHGSNTSTMLVEGCAFVGNSAPMGGAVMWESTGSMSVIHSVFAGNAASGSWIAGSLPTDGMPDSVCNFMWMEDPADDNESLDDDVVLPSAPSVADGMGGAIAVNPAGIEFVTIKNVFIENRAGAGGAIAAVKTVEDGEGAPGPGMGDAGWVLNLTHDTFAANEADDGAAVWLGEDVNAYLLAAGNLWLEHDTDPLSAHEDGWRAVLTGNHTDGPPLADGVSVPVIELDETCGAAPARRACSGGCGAAADQDMCGSVYDSVTDSWGFPTALHVGHELCPEEDSGPCEAGDEDGCEIVQGACVWQAAIDDPIFEMSDGLADRGFTGLECSLAWIWLPDADGDHVPDYAECDVAGEPPASEDGDRNAFAEETCNGLDDNCDGQADEGLLVEYYQDLDGDGHGGGEPILSCDPLGDLFTTADDCDDSDASVHPLATEAFDDGVDNDCDGVIDLDAPGCHSAGCLATRVAPGEDGLELNFAPVAPGLLLTGLWGVGRRARRRVATRSRR